ncbi:hypothetical protein C1H46_029760 [Malus baccata]|uniref:Plastocyanin-like domain-containing protein n=2 Tax=Malus TaxID=3749 RepID=A0A540LEG9_MALBA|nr:hypothetical protein C1H46_029760 [Malus baccata]
MNSSAFIGNTVPTTKLSVRKTQKSMASEARTAKWRGSVGGIVEAPIDKVWSMVSQTKRLAEWMPMVERCTDLAGEEGVPGYVRLVSGFMFPQDDGDRSWIKEKLVSMDSSQHSYAYKLEASNVGLDGSVNSLKLVDYGDESTLVDWSFEVNPVEGAREDSTVDYLGFLYKSCINRIEAALEAASKKVVFKSTTNLCSSKPIVTVNGKFPGPALYAREDYTVIVKVTNHVNRSVTIHWHGVKQLRTGRRGTPLWHAHDSWLRAALHDAMVILPKRGIPYPFHTLVCEENLSSRGTEMGGYTLHVESGKTYLLRIVNAPLNDDLFFKGIWFLHCHLEVHTTWGLKMAFTVENGEGPNEFMSPPPTDLPTFWIFRPERLSN